MSDFVRDIMTKDLITIDAEQSAMEAAKSMSVHGISSIIVTSNNKPIGIVTERDFLKKICLKDLTISDTKIGDIMSKIQTFATPDTPLDVAVQRMLNKKIRRLPIVDTNGNLVGIITVTDLAKHLRKILLIDGALSISDR